METYLDILAKNSTISKREDRLFRASFVTSADVVMEASGLRIEAIRVIAREQGVEIEDTACKCIGESLLAALADAHVRKLKAYFNNAKRHIAELSGEELATFLDFCETFESRQSTNSTAKAWSDIDTDAIREQFIQKVHELTPSPWSDLFAGCGGVSEDILESLSYKFCEKISLAKYRKQCEVIEKVLHSNLFYAKPSKVKLPSIVIRPIIWRVTLSARYHIFTSDDDNHQHDTFDNNIINRAPAMVA